MSAYSELTITVRRKDRRPVTQEDLSKFEDFFNNGDLYRTATFSSPHICNDGKEILTSCEIKHTLEPAAVLVFSIANPHLQIEVIESCDDEDVGMTRYLFEGVVWEMLEQNREFEEPKSIDWPIGHVHVPEDRRKLADYASEPGFFQWFGEQIRNCYKDDSEPEDSFAEMVTSAYLSDSAEALFIGLVGWSLEDLLDRWEEFKTDSMDDAKVAEGARKILEEGLF